MNNTFLFKIKHVICIAEHTELNGLVERVNRAFAFTLAAFVNLTHTDWDLKLHQASSLLTL